MEPANWAQGMVYRTHSNSNTAQFFQLFILNWKSNSSFSPNSIGPGEKKEVDFDFKINS